MNYAAQRKRRLGLRYVVLGVALGALAACSLPVNDRGDLPKPDALSQIKPGVTDKQTVRRLIGSPSTVASFDDNVWYYISRQTKPIAFLKPEVLAQKVVIIHFDPKGVVTAVDERGLKDAKAVTPNPNATPAQGRKFTFLEQLIGNFGKFNNSQASTPGSPNPGGGP